jgi:hypothetical protein
LQARKQGVKKSRAIVQWQPDQVNDSVVFWGFQQLYHLSDTGWALRVAKSDSGVKGLIISFRVNNAKLIAPCGQAL